MSKSKHFSNSVAHAQESVNEAVSGMKQAGAAVNDEAGSAMDGLRNAAGDLATSAREGITCAKNSALDYFQRGEKEAERFGKEVQKRIRKRPVPALAIAVGAGAVLGILVAALSRRSS